MNITDEELAASEAAQKKLEEELAAEIARAEALGLKVPDLSSLDIFQKLAYLRQLRKICDEIEAGHISVEDAQDQVDKIIVGGNPSSGGYPGASTIYSANISGKFVNVQAMTASTAVLSGLDWGNILGQIGSQILAGLTAIAALVGSIFGGISFGWAILVAVAVAGVVWLLWEIATAQPAPLADTVLTDEQKDVINNTYGHILNWFKRALSLVTADLILKVRDRNQWDSGSWGSPEVNFLLHFGQHGGDFSGWDPLGYYVDSITDRGYATIYLGWEELDPKGEKRRYKSLSGVYPAKRYIHLNSNNNLRIISYGSTS